MSASSTRMSAPPGQGLSSVLLPTVPQCLQHCVAGTQGTPGERTHSPVPAMLHPCSDTSDSAQAVPVKLWQRNAWNSEAEGEAVTPATRHKGAQGAACSHQPGHRCLRSPVLDPSNAGTFPSYSKMFISIKKKSLLNYFTCGTGSFRPVLAKASNFPVTPTLTRSTIRPFMTRKWHRPPHQGSQRTWKSQICWCDNTVKGVCVRARVEGSFPPALHLLQQP